MWLTPKILAADERGVVAVDPHWPPWAVWGLLAVFTAGPAVYAGLSAGEPAMRIAFAVCGGALFGIPLLTMIAFRRYRWVEAKPGVEVVLERRSYFFPPKVERTAWADVVRMRCLLLPGSGGPDGRIAGLRLLMERTDGSTTVRSMELLGGWWSDEVAATLRRHLWQKMVE